MLKILNNSDKRNQMKPKKYKKNMKKEFKTDYSKNNRSKINRLFSTL